MIILSVPFSQKDEAKALGAMWNPKLNKWFINEYKEEFKRWMPKEKKALEGQHLSIELVPKTCWFSNVRDHVSKEQWKQIQKYTFEKTDYKCEICGGVGDKHPVECHEIWDYNFFRKEQKLVRTEALCPNCHQVKHIGFALKNGKYGEARDWLIQINGYSFQQAENYISACFSEWDRKSQSEWNLNLSWLKETFDIKVKEKR